MQRRKARDPSLHARQLRHHQPSARRACADGEEEEELEGEEEEEEEEVEEEEEGEEEEEPHGTNLLLAGEMRVTSQTQAKSHSISSRWGT